MVAFDACLRDNDLRAIVSAVRLKKLAKKSCRIAHKKEQFLMLTTIKKINIRSKKTRHL